ncbi:non-ribosomal peptide synthetase component F [Nocardioides ginsengisegetis]|uniref:Non-ribosomal peptide synthetase component F n=1 Tax=Nocardioides ginsengisegetis TaxID=661491 RepID=A0A7W3IZS8_9ACTN|nr:non-ribosomal peptide synthetase component F [Nocardioides ginsengisegetis]
MTTGLYAYALSRGLTDADVSGQPGIGGAPLRLVQLEGLVAVVSEVDLEEFGEEGLRRNLEDLRWLESVAIAHDDVARHAAGRAPTAPLRLATVFLGEESLAAQLAEWHDSAERALDRIEGRSEWSVKAYADPAVRAEPEAQQPPAEGVGAGRAYLLQRRAATQRRAASAQEDADLAQELHEVLADHATLSRRLAPQDRQLTGHTGEMILNGTYLLDDTQVDDFRQLVAELDGRHGHVRVELGGPWPPYSFSSLDAP